MAPTSITGNPSESWRLCPIPLSSKFFVPRWVEGILLLGGVQEGGVYGGGGSCEVGGGRGPWLFRRNVDSRGEAGGKGWLPVYFGEELVWGKDVLGGDLVGSFSICFSFLKRVFQKEASNAWNLQDAKVPLSLTLGMTSWRIRTIHCLFVRIALPTLRGWSHHSVRRRVGMWVLSFLKIFWCKCVDKRQFGFELSVCFKTFHKLVHSWFDYLSLVSLVFVIFILHFGVGILQNDPKVSV